jgi:mannosyl-3-phosphoglycerate phosphatase
MSGKCFLEASTLRYVHSTFNKSGKPGSDGAETPTIDTLVDILVYTLNQLTMPKTHENGPFLTGVHRMRATLSLLGLTPKESSVTRPHLLIFSDLDGTLLSHERHCWQQALPALERIAAAGIPLILNSSKTAAEIRELRQQLENTHPFVVENGAVVVIPADTFGNHSEQIVRFGASRTDVLKVLAEQRASGARFRGFADMSDDELAQFTGLDSASASRARKREATEPLLWEGSEEEFLRFDAALRAENLRLVKGGRFYHAMGIFDKADGARFLLDKYQEHYGNQPLTAIALGDSPNDQQMLEAADIPVVILGVNSNEVQLPSAKHALRSLKPGPEGWNNCVLNLLFEYGY